MDKEKLTRLEYFAAHAPVPPTEVQFKRVEDHADWVMDYVNAVLKRIDEIKAKEKAAKAKEVNIYPTLEELAKMKPQTIQEALEEIVAERITNNVKAKK